MGYRSTAPQSVGLAPLIAILCAAGWGRAHANPPGAECASPEDFTVYGFSQSEANQEDPQIYELRPDVNIRAFQKWSTSGDEASDYQFAQIERYHEKGIAFIGGGTASVIFREEFASDGIFDDLSTRDANNLPVPHDYIVPVGMYPFNRDEETPDFRGADYVPVVDGHLNGAKSLLANFRYLKDTSALISGDVPLVVFIDWPNDMMTSYLNLPLSEQKDYWQIFGAEAYASGIYPAFHLRDTVGSPTATELGLMGFFQEYTRFYKRNRRLYRKNARATNRVSLGASNIAANLLSQRGGRLLTLHLINHNYNQAIIPQGEFIVEVDLPSRPSRVTMVSPDFEGSKRPDHTFSNGTLTVKVDGIRYYDVVVIE